MTSLSVHDEMVNRGSSVGIGYLGLILERTLILNIGLSNGNIFTDLSAINCNGSSGIAHLGFQPKRENA